MLLYYLRRFVRIACFNTLPIIASTHSNSMRLWNKSYGRNKSTYTHTHTRARAVAHACFLSLPRAHVHPIVLYKKNSKPKHIKVYYLLSFLFLSFTLSLSLSLSLSPPLSLSVSLSLSIDHWCVFLHTRVNETNKQVYTFCVLNIWYKIKSMVSAYNILFLNNISYNKQYFIYIFFINRNKIIFDKFKLNDQISYRRYWWLLLFRGKKKKTRVTQEMKDDVTSHLKLSFIL